MIHDYVHPDIIAYFPVVPHHHCTSYYVRSNYLSNRSSKMLEMEQSKRNIILILSYRKSKTPKIEHGKRNITSLSERFYYFLAGNKGVIY